MIDYDVAYANPELAEVADLLRKWISENSQLTYFTFDQLISTVEFDKLDKLNLVLLRLVAAKQLKASFRVKFGAGDYSECEFNSLRDIPDVVFDSSFRAFNVSDRDIVSSYSPAI